MTVETRYEIRDATLQPVHLRDLIRYSYSGDGEGDALPKRRKTFAFSAIRGDFVLVARQANREVLSVRPGSLRLVKPTDDAWRLRVRLLTAISLLGALSTSFTANYLRTIHADLLSWVVSISIIATVLIPIAHFEEAAIWPILAWRSVEPGLELQLRSVAYGRFGHTLLAATDGKELKVTVYGSRKRLTKALEVLREPIGLPTIRR